MSASFEQDLKAWVASRREAMIASLRVLVEHESPSRDKTALDPLARTVAGRFERLGGNVRRVANPDGGDHVVARFGEGDARPILVLGHFDTVWPIGTLAGMPFVVEEGVIRGPGAYDMKAGLVQLEFALTALAELGRWPSRPLVALWTSDEEIGSPTSRDLIEAQARESHCALVLEPPLSGGPLKTARKGVGQYRIKVEGRPAHAGVEPEKGINAILELARQVIAVQGMNRPEVGTTLNVGLIEGGTTPNVVPARAKAVVDVRVASAAEARRIAEALSALIPVAPGAKLTVSGGVNRPPMERTPQGAALFATACEVGRSLGLELSEGSTGGGSDGNFTAAVGTPTLDGLGSDGRGAHAPDEQIKVDSLLERTALLAALLLHL